jgi:putative addiction module killer protein
MSIVKIAIYTTASGKSPYKEWLSDLDTTTRAIIRTRLDRIVLGNYGDCKVLSGAKGIAELRINFGPGYRLYFGKDGESLVILLTGGNKGTQDKDVAKAKKYWSEYKELKQKGLL